MANFSTAYKHTARVEGGYANHPSDTGGETWRGIARKKNPKWPGWIIVDSLRAKPGFPQSLAKSEDLQKHVLAIYKRQYWDVMNLDLLNNQQVATELYDTGVNAGPGVAAVFFQRVLNVCNLNGKLFPDLVVDGAVGPVTISAFNKLSNTDQLMVWRLLNCLQGEKYVSIAEANRSQEVFMRSWASRVFEN